MNLPIATLFLSQFLGTVIASHHNFIACMDDYERALGLVCLEDKYGGNFIDDLEDVLVKMIHDADPSKGMTIDQKLRKIYWPRRYCKANRNAQGACCRMGCYKRFLLQVCRKCF